MRIRRLCDFSKHANIRIIGITKEAGQENENVFEKIMKENFPNLTKERHTSWGSTESPKQAGPKEGNNKTHHN